MTDERWEEVIDRIKETFPVIDHEHEDLDPGPGTREYVSFTGPAGKMRLERTVKPRVLEVRGQGSKRAGSHTAIDFHYSNSEFVHTVKAYRWDDARAEWVDMEAIPGFGV